MGKMRVEVIHKKDDLNRKVWTFSFECGYASPYFVLEKYQDQNRKTKKCKWVTDKYYSRLDRRDSNCSAIDIITDTIMIEAKQLLLKEIEETIFPTLKIGEKYK
jgi:hypothetical protein